MLRIENCSSMLRSITTGNGHVQRWAIIPQLNSRLWKNMRNIVPTFLWPYQFGEVAFLITLEPVVDIRPILV